MTDRTLVINRYFDAYGGVQDQNGGPTARTSYTLSMCLKGEGEEGLGEVKVPRKGNKSVRD